MLGIYLHIPFCQSKCPYCDFFSVVAAESQRRAYPGMLRRHLAWAADHGWAGPVGTVYFGGGTPSLLSPRAIGGVLETIAERFGLTADAEVTLEANPGTVTVARLAGYRASGVNRLSLGLQSLDGRQLAILGRQHDRAAAKQAVRWARQAGFANLSLDLIFALPGQTLPELDAELDSYLALAPEHLSCYGLTAEPQTSLHKLVQAGVLTLPEADFAAEAYLLVHARLRAAGYEHYEIANFARPGHTCRHNLGYWQRRACLGVGAGAHSFRNKGWGERWAVPASLATYSAALRSSREPAECLEQFDRTMAMGETLYLGLRSRLGIEEQAFRRQFGCGVAEAYPQEVARLQPWLSQAAGRWQMSVDGWLLYDRLIQAFL